MFREDENKNVQFEEWKRPSNSYGSTEGSKLSELVIKYSGGLIKNEKQANVVLVGVIILAVVIAIILILSIGGENAEIKAPTGQKVIYPQNEPPRLQ